ncbi:hypothetical protein LCGC14_0441690 [marine sediment metagenome]|uniref:Uncharacterized protein n=1 Tax=marine sediment metagenome TaxID=412755 RepID=A0A0F9V733_9ZZZZ
MKTETKEELRDKIKELEEKITDLHMEMAGPSA